MEGTELIEAWRDTISGFDKSWVAFENGTCVVLMEPEDDLGKQAVELLREFGPVHAGSSFGDFNVITLDDGRGWVVTCHHNDILTMVGPNEANTDDSDLSIGLLGRSKRGLDAEQLNVLHIEDNRNS